MNIEKPEYRWGNKDHHLPQPVLFLTKEMEELLLTKSFSFNDVIYLDKLLTVFDYETIVAFICLNTNEKLKSVENTYPFDKEVIMGVWKSELGSRLKEYQNGLNRIRDELKQNGNSALKKALKSFDDKNPKSYVVKHHENGIYVILINEEIDKEISSEVFGDTDINLNIARDVIKAFNIYHGFGNLNYFPWFEHYVKLLQKSQK